jgi:hypothetical protein
MGHSYKGRGINASAANNLLAKVVITGQGTTQLSWSVTGVAPTNAFVDSAPAATGPWSRYSTSNWTFFPLTVGANFYRVTGVDANNIPMTITSDPGSYT